MITQIFPVSTKFNSIEECIDVAFINDSCEVSFSERSIHFLDKLSKKILKSPHAKKHPEIISFGFWLRKSNMLRMIQSTIASEKIVKVPRGISFHITPSNVDIMFLYSWVLSFVAGNKNIIRISKTDSPVVSIVLEYMIELTQQIEYKTLSYNTKIIHYFRNEEINAYLSSICDLRIIWGGDATVSYFKTLKTKPNNKDVTFSDKFSFSVLNSDSFLEENEAAQYVIVNNFYNDSYWFDQMACSSPQVVFFVGNSDTNEQASDIFESSLKKVLTEKNYIKALSNNMDHLVNWYKLAASYVQKEKMKVEALTPTFFNTSLANIPYEYKTCGGGFFLQCFIDNIKDLALFNSNKHQTMTYFGFNSEELRNFVLMKGYSSPSRIVPIGSALNFDYLWDGYNLLHEFTKDININ
jgi:hypothetical protein